MQVSEESGVLVVGAGPAGLLTAYGLARAGLQVTVIDAAEAVNDSPRAMVYLPVSLKTLDEFDLLQAADAVGARGYEYNLRFGSGYIGRLDQRVLSQDTPYPYMLHLGQDVLASIVLRRLQAMSNVRVLWNHCLEGLEQRGGKVSALVSTPAGERRFESEWLIGADGARSAVRKLLGIEFEGFTWPDVFMAVNVRHDFALHGYAEATMVADPDHWAVISKIDDAGLWRVSYGEDASLSTEAQQARVRACIARYLPPGQQFGIERSNPFRVHQRTASRYREGRVLLVGDAAHATNPLGGLGLTAGIQDAGMLVTALTAVVREGADEDWLDYYAAERRRIFLAVVNPMAIEHKRRVQERDPAKRELDEQNFRQVAADPAFVRTAMLSMFAIAGRPYKPNWREGFEPGKTVTEHPMALFGADPEL